MVDVSNYDFKYLTEKIVKPEESFINAYLDKCLKCESPISPMRRMRIIIDAKYKKGLPENVYDQTISTLIHQRTINTP